MQQCCAPLLSQLTRLHAAIRTMSSYPAIKPSQLPRMRDLSLEAAPRGAALACAEALPALTALHVHHTWFSMDRSAALLQAAHT